MRVIKFVLLHVISFIHIFFDLKILRSLNKFVITIRSCWYRNEFQKIGNNVLFGHSLTLLGEDCINIGDNVSFGRNCVLTAWKKYGEEEFAPQIVIESDCHFGEYNHITSTNGIFIDTGLLTGRWVTITDNSHGKINMESLNVPPIKRPIYSKGIVRIGKNVWIGDKATILPGVTIGDGVVIGANSVVTKDIPSFSVAVGNPAVVVKR